MLKAHDLEVIGVLGSNGKERLNFFMPLKSYTLQKTSEWFLNFLKLMKSSVCKQTQTYLDRLELFSGLGFFLHLI